MSFPSRDMLSLGAASKASSSSKLFLYVCKCVTVIWNLIAPQKPCILPTAAARERTGAEDTGLRTRPRVCTHARWRRPAAERFTGCHGLPAPHTPPAHANQKRSFLQRWEPTAAPAASRGQGLVLPQLPVASSHRRTQDSPPSLARHH